MIRKDFLKPESECFWETGCIGPKHALKKFKRITGHISMFSGNVWWKLFQKASPLRSQDHMEFFRNHFWAAFFFSSKRSTEFPIPKKAEYQVIFSQNRTGAHLEVGFSRSQGWWTAEMLDVGFDSWETMRRNHLFLLEFIDVYMLFTSWTNPKWCESLQHLFPSSWPGYPWGYSKNTQNVNRECFLWNPSMSSLGCYG